MSPNPSDRHDPCGSAEVYGAYLRNLVEHLWTFRQSRFSGRDDLFDGRVRPSPPVFRADAAHWNLLHQPSETGDALRSFAESLGAKPHRWFASGRSSQALALGVFGRLRALDRLDALAGLRDADDPTSQLFPVDLGASCDVAFEREVTYLGEPRRTSVDVFLTGERGRVAVECKLSETEVGACSQPESGACDGSYRRRRGDGDRCALTAKGVLYWRFVPELFSWSADTNFADCPLRRPYQLVRNVLASAVRSNGEIGDGAAVLLYDTRNPHFQPGGVGDLAYNQARGSLRNSSRLRRGTWQTVAAALRADAELAWLGDELRLKYGF